ncbi:hypothetical protein K474DRAFT_241814 [Panus rudis PR-1116 ss-1]|nr:hypothetical protein K474DRAFT_241814 [Panus rudis PR-1116 ss-1]
MLAMCTGSELHCFPPTSMISGGERSKKDMTILSLNNDVLLVMLSYLERHDLSMTMKTCKALHELCVPVILRAPLTLSPENLISFRQFICATACDRGRYLRGIHLEWGSMKPYVVVQKQAIVDILGSSPRLQSLSIQSLACLEYSGNDAADTLNNIPALRRLRLAEITDHGWTVLSKVRFPLTHLDIATLRTTHTGFDGIPNVAQWADTLEGLSLNWCICRDISTSFPRLRRLRMNILPTVDIGSLLSSLPMLQSLRLEYAATFGYPALAVQIHERNVLIQSRLAILPPIEEPILDTRTLYMLAPQFPVCTLWLTNLNDLFVGRDAIPDILQTLSPRQIRIGTMMVSILSYIGPNFLTPASKHLTHLAIGLSLYYHLPINVAWDKLQVFLRSSHQLISRTHSHCDGNRNSCS